MIRSCAQCGAKNRIPAVRLSDKGRCGKCGAELPAANMPLDVDATEFREIIAGARVPVLVDFWAAWCGPCKMAAPEVAKTAAAMSGRALVLKVDTESHPELSSQYGIRGIPNFIVFRNGEVAAQHAGLVDHRTMQQWLEAAAGDSDRSGRQAN